MFRKLNKKYTPKLIAEAMEKDDDEDTSESSSQSSEVKDLISCMSTALVLSQVAHAYHWNYEGPSFAELHGVFGGIYDELGSDVDEIAERIRALDATTPSSLSSMIKNSKVDDSDCDEESSKMVKTLLSCFEKYQKCLNESINNNQDSNATVELLSGHLVYAEKIIWMLKSTK